MGKGGVEPPTRGMLNRRSPAELLAPEPTPGIEPGPHPYDGCVLPLTLGRPTGDLAHEGHPPLGALRRLDQGPRLRHHGHVPSGCTPRVRGVPAWTEWGL